MSKILIKNGFVVDMINQSQEIVKKDILIENDKIVKIDKDIKLKAEKVIDANDKIVMPGLINCHNHSAMTLFRGYADDTKLMDWLQNKIWPVEDKLTKEQVYYGSLLACIEMIKSGTTTFNDMYFYMEETAKAVEESKIRACLGRCIMEVKSLEDERVKEAILLYEKYNNSCNARLKVNIALHALYTCNKEAIKLGKSLAKKYNILLHIHLDETETEHKDILEKYKVTPTKYLYDEGILNDNHIILAHCVHQDEEDIKLLKNINGGIVHCPVSNLKLASGIAPITTYLKEGITVGLGTDGAGSTNTLDMFEEMRVCNLLQKVRTFTPDSITAYDALKMATINGAKILGIDDMVGTLEVGKKADIIIVDMDKAHLKPINSIYSNLVYATNGQDVVTTIVDGNILMEDRKITFVDENKIFNKVQEISDEIFRN